MPAKTHGLSHSRTWNTWQDMMRRCYHKHRPYYHRYGGRGISVCDRWHKFENFVEDMGICPEGLVLDRINNDGNYEPSNCRWTTYKENNNNRRSNKPITVFGKYFVTMSDAARYFKVNIKTFRSRIYQMGLTPEDAVLKKSRVSKSRSNKYLDISGEVFSNV